MPGTRQATGHDEASPLGAWIRSVRVQQGLSQRELADRSNLSRSYVCDIERGRGAHPSVETLDKLGAALGFSRVDLLRASGVIEAASGPRESEEERRMLAVFRDLTDEGQRAVMRFARFVHADEHRWVQETLLDAGQVTADGAAPVPPANNMPRLFDLGDD